MASSETPGELPPDAPPPALGDAVRTEALKIADWCQDQREAAETRAAAQIRVVWLLLLGGLILLLILPRVLQEIDFAWQKDSLPPAVISSAKETRASIAQNREEMEEEVTSAKESLAEMESALKEAQDRANGRAEEFTAAMARRGTAWKSAVQGSVEGTLSAREIIQQRDGSLLVIGEMPDDGVNSREAVLYTEGDLNWSLVFPDVSGGIVHAARSPRGVFAFAALNGPQSTSLSVSPDGITWNDVWPTSGQPSSVADMSFWDMALLQDGAMIAVGGTEEREAQQVLLLSDDGLTWTPVGQSQPGLLTAGVFSSVAAWNDGTLVAGLARTSEGEERPVILTTTDGRNWSALDIAPSGLPEFGGIFNLRSRATGPLLAEVASSSERSLFRSERGVRWTKVETPGSFQTLLPGRSGPFAIVTSRSTRGGPEFDVMASNDGSEWTSVGLSQEFFPEFGQIEIAFLEDGRLLGTKDGELFVSLLADQAEKIAAEAILIEGLPPDLVLTSDANRIFEGYLGQRERISTIEQNIRQQTNFLATVDASYTRQDDALTEFDELSTALETALRAAEAPRQLAQIGTRLAVIGLLIYLVQIVVNRYRYLQRLAGFYQARAQALRLLAASPDAALLRGVSLGDVTAMLSPDAIGFDKSAEPPTGQMVSLLQAGLRRS